MKSFGCCAGQLCTASFTTSNDLKWRPCRVSFRGQKRWLPQGVNCGEYGRWGNTFNFESCTCFMLWPAVWRQALSCCRHTRGQQTMEFSLSCWLKLIPGHDTVPDTVHKLKLSQAIRVFYLPGKTMYQLWKLSQAVSYYEPYTLFLFFIWVTFVGGIDMCVCTRVHALVCVEFIYFLSPNNELFWMNSLKSRCLCHCPSSLCDWKVL